jgi:cell division protein FtsB
MFFSTMLATVFTIVNGVTLKNRRNKPVNETMRLKYLLAPWTAVAVYALSSLYAGSSGILPYRELLKERELILDNLEELELVNRKLEGSADALLYDSETIKLKARELGYGEENEGFIRIVGLPTVRKQNIQPGIVKTAGKPTGIPDLKLRIAALLAGLAVFCLLLIPDILKKYTSGLRNPPNGRFESTRFPPSTG